MLKIFDSIDIKQLDQPFDTEEQCLEFLAAQKWTDGFVCRNCGHTNYCKGKTPYSRRCTRCKHEESATAHTIFHRCRIPLTKAFELAFMVCEQPGISSYEISRRIDIRQMTCWKFKRKIMECLEHRTDLSSAEKNRISSQLGEE
ncbi:MAG: transposase [Bacteroidales bacterium]|nr:transposase [Bacteroidales bacterium]